ncbi:MAG: hypothetical protein ACYTGL_12455 [Planctomycetota bacterium]|jgi:hypothetical protein
MAVSFFGLIVLLVLVTCLIGACGFVVRAFTSRDVVAVHAPPHRSNPTSVIAGFVFAGLILFAVLALFLLTARVSQQHAATVYHETAQSTPPGAATAFTRAGIRGASESRTNFNAGVTVTVSSDNENSAPTENPQSDDAATSPALPDWAQTEEHVIATGRVPIVHRVIRSGLYATQKEAATQAVARVHDELRERMATDYPKLAAWKIPEQTLNTNSVKQSFTEVRQTQFGQYREPMYQVWLQYEDSPHVRESIIHEWERSAVDGRTVLFAAGAGVIALLLGTVSAGVRTVTAPRGRRGRPALATLALGVGTGVAALSIFIS